jgi:hypothetical protein
VSIGRVKYARTGDIRLAYREMGDGDIPVVLVPGWVSNVDLYDDPTTLYAGVAERLSRHVRLIVWDKRGTGPLGSRLSRAADRRTHGRSRFSQDLPDRPWGFTPEQIAAGYDDIENHWGEGALAELFFGPVADIPGVREMWGREQRASASPMMARLMWQAVAEIDVRGVLDSVRTPTLVMGAGATGSRPSNPQRSWPRGFRTPTCANCRRANTMRQTWSSCFHGQPSNSLGSKRMRCLPSGC